MVDRMAVPAGRAAVRERGSAPDVVGAVVLGACAVWALISAAAGGGRPEGILLAVLALAAGYACGRISGGTVPVAAASVVAVAALAAAVVSGRDTPAASVAVATPQGDSGAVAALLALAAGAACCAATSARRHRSRVLLRLLAVTIAAAALLLGSVAGLVAVLGVLLCSLAAARMRRRSAALAGLALVAALVVGGSWAVAEDALPEGLSVSLEGQLTTNRVQLWHEAVDLAKEHPLLGVGPDRFGDLSPTALQSLDSDGKPHSAALQEVSEQGVVGLLLLATVFGWLLHGLVRSPCSTPVVLTAGATLTALATLASVGNALSFAPVTAGAGLLAGLATARPAGRLVPHALPALNRAPG
ncbi:O-antigen ligase family protein [Streptomyces liangshanensis]|uniref:O-antigen ligase family protein n=2 Tax=Streptomyces liangshanensis TaxID=2717324 RepID=A0A6G9H6Z1_9ACTN|nr:O-antigen ligase family protein [Streptomyces liangshanensis]